MPRSSWQVAAACAAAAPCAWWTATPTTRNPMKAKCTRARARTRSCARMRAHTRRKHARHARAHTRRLAASLCRTHTQLRRANARTRAHTRTYTYTHATDRVSLWRRRPCTGPSGFAILRSYLIVCKGPPVDPSPPPSPHPPFPPSADKPRDKAVRGQERMCRAYSGAVREGTSGAPCSVHCNA